MNLSAEMCRAARLASPSEEGPRGISALRQKMSDYIRNSAQLGWLLPSERAVEIWRSGSPASEPERRAPASQLAGGPLLPGFWLGLGQILEA